MQFDQLGNLFEDGLNNQLGDAFKGVYKGYGSIDDMQDIDADKFRKQMRINTDGLSEFTMAQIKAKSASLGLTDSLTAQVVAMASDADILAQSATGRLTWNKALKDNRIGANDLIDSLSKLENIDTKNLSKLNDIKELDIDDSKKKIAIQEVVDNVQNLGDSIVDLGSAGTTAGKSISSVFKGMAASIAPLLPLIAGVGGAFALFEGFKFLDDKFTLTFGTAQRHLSESSSAYSSTVSELSSMNSQLETSNARIDELKNKGSLSFTEKAELSKLERQNSLLETQIKIKERLAESQGKEAAEAARESIDFKSESVMMTDKNGKPILDKSGLEKKELISRKEYAKRQIDALKEEQNLLEKAQDKFAKAKSEKDKDLWASQIESSTKNINDYKTSVQEILSELNEESINFYNPETNRVLQGYEKDVEELNELNNLFEGIDLNPTEKVLKSINSAFDSKSSNSIKDSIIDMLKSGDVNSATDALHRLGVTLSDLGIKGEGKKKIFDDYFDELINNANEAENAIKKVDGTFNGVKTAFESANQGAEYDQMKEFIKKAKELKKNGDVGTDDFQSVAQFGVDYDISQKLKDGADAYTFASDAYVEAYEKSIKLLNRWYGNEDDNKNMHNILSDFQNKGLARKLDKDTFSFKNKDGELMFKTTAEAANKLGTSVQNVELAMDKLREKGFEFDGIQKSGELLGEYNTQLERLKELSKTTEDSDRKKELDAKIKGWEDDAEKFKNPEYLASLTEEQIIKIKFEYDLESINQEIAALKEEIEGTGGTAEQRGQLIAKEQRKQKLLSSQSGMEKATSDNGFKESEKQFDNFSKILESKYEELGSKGRRVVQDQQLAISDLQNSYLEMFKNGDITNWNDFLNTEQAKTIFDELSSKTGETITNFEDMKQAIADALSIDVKDLNFEVDADTSKAEEKLSEILSNNKKTTIMIDASTEEVQSAINKLKSEGETGAKIVFTADVDGVSSEVAAVKNEDGTVSYIANVDGVYYYLNDVKNQDGTVNYTLGEHPKEVPPAQGFANFMLGISPTTVPDADGIANYTGEFPKKAPTITGWINYYSKVINEPKNSGYQKGKGPVYPSFNGTAHAFGTAYATGNWGAKKSGKSLVGELGRETIVRGSEYFTVGDNGAELTDIRKGDIIFNH